MLLIDLLFFFFFKDTATTEIYTLSLHDALPISLPCEFEIAQGEYTGRPSALRLRVDAEDRKSTRLNSSHQIISYAVFCLKKKKKRMVSLTRPGVVKVLFPNPDNVHFSRTYL